MRRAPLSSPALGPSTNFPARLLYLVALAGVGCGDDGDGSKSESTSAASGATTAASTLDDLPPSPPPAPPPMTTTGAMTTSGPSTTSGGSTTGAPECTATSCPEGQFCAVPIGYCPGPGMGGRCIPKPTSCDANLDYVCGCDDKTYTNACEANVAGVSAKSSRECGLTTCNELPGGPRCGMAQWCDYADDKCGKGTNNGDCTSSEKACADDDVKVCGCDGKPYANACLAHQAGVDVGPADACK